MLEIKNVVKHYNHKKAVDNISFSVEKGKIFGLLGPNGAGKSTLLRMITGITYPDAGEILLDNETLNPLLHNIHIGYMPEERGLYKKMKAGEQALYLSQLKGMSYTDAKQSIKKWFAEMEMDTWFNKKVEDLSKGMSQKLQFIITILHKPKLLILDEPFSGLDPVNSNIIKEKIYDLANNGTTIIFSTHRMEQVEEICNEIVLINKGKNILSGNVTAVKESYKENIFSLELYSASTISNNDLFQITENIENRKYKLKLSGDTNPNQVLLYCINNNFHVQSFNEILPSLNEIFISLVNQSAVSQFENQ